MQLCGKRYFEPCDVGTSLSSMQSAQTVVVVGAGVAGLQTARAFLKRGFDVLVLEQSDDVGGLWAKRYHGSSFGVQGEHLTTS